MMLFGCFLPVVHAPLFGSVSYMIGVDGKSVGAFGATALILGLRGWLRMASIAGWLGLLITGFDFFHIQSLDASENVKMATLGEAWPVIFIGAGLLIAAAFMRSRRVEVCES
jgi:hypothetical protein